MRFPRTLLCCAGLLFTAAGAHAQPKSQKTPGSIWDKPTQKQAFDKQPDKRNGLCEPLFCQLPQRLPQKARS